MQFPWVSRQRLEDAERRLTKADEERLRLLDLLLEGGAERTRTHTMAAQAEVIPIDPREKLEREATPVDVEQYTTPFDRIERNFTRALRSGPVSRKFVARG